MAKNTSTQRARGSSLLSRVLRDRRGRVGLVLVGGMVVIAIFAPWIAPHDPLAQSFDKLASSSSRNLLGTDDLRRDLLSRLIYGARISIAVSFCGVSIGALVGTLLGLIAAQRGGILGGAIMRSAEIIQAFPGIIFAILIIAILGTGTVQIGLAIVVNSIPLFARVTHGSILKEMQLDYVAATVSLGAPSFRVAWRHLLPNALSDVVPLVSLRLGAGVLFEAALSFIGLGAARPTPTWGRLLSDGRPYLAQAPLQALVPGVAIVVLVIGFTLLGDAVQLAIDPKSRRRSLSVDDEEASSGAVGSPVATASVL